MYWLRYWLARSLYSILRLRIAYWKRQVRDMWGLTELEREQALSAILEARLMSDREGQLVKDLSDLEPAKSTTKADLNDQASQLDRKEIRSFKRHTAGTTGDPTQIRLSRRELGRMLGVREYCFNHWGLSLGDREARLWGRTDLTRLTQIKNFLMHRKVFHASGENVRSELKKLIKWKPTYIYGYSSLILELVQFIDKNSLKPPRLKIVICTAETILPSQKKYVEQVLSAPVVEEYGSTEFDIVAFECMHKHRHLVNPWLWIKSEFGENMFTDVSRESQTLINYAIGDHLAISKTGCKELGSNCIISTLEGRSIHRFAWFDPNEKFHSSEFSAVITKFQNERNDFFQFFIQQKDYSEFNIFLNPEPMAGSDELVSEIKKYIFKRYKKNIHIDASNSRQKPRGKRSYFVQSIK